MAVILAIFVFGDVIGARAMTARCQWCTDSMTELAGKVKDNFK
ncbi:MAG: hypothetical protein ACJA2Q_000815 [Pseudohongiellaceae bacterium]|jgi:hypothetical protein